MLSRSISFFYSMPTKSLTMPYHQEQILAIYLEEELLLQQKKS